MSKLKSEQKLGLINEFTVLWRDFFRRFEEGLVAPELTSEMESEFLKIESRIAMRKQILGHMMPEEFSFGGDIIKVLTGAVSLDQLREESSIRVDTIKNQWHDVFIALNKLTGALKEAVALENPKHK